MSRMPSPLHEVIIDMFRGRPALAASLLDHSLGDALPAHDEAHLDSAEFTDVVPTEYRADAVVRLSRTGVDVFAAVIEVQLRAAAQKRRSWPAYVATLHARLGCPVALLVICPDARVAGWAAEPIELGPPGSRVRPVALGPEQTPVVTDPDEARRSPELAVLSTLVHAGRQDPYPLFKALLEAFGALGTGRASLYYDFLTTELSSVTAKLLEDFVTATDYHYRSDFARHHFAEGKAEGEAEALLTILDARGLALSEEVRTRITSCTDLDLLKQWLRQAATAERVEELAGLSTD